MKAVTFLYVDGGWFVIAVVFDYFHKYNRESAVMTPAYIVLLCGIIARIPNFWTSRQNHP